MHVRTRLVELSPEEFHAHYSTENNEKENEDRHIHQGNQRHQNGVHDDLQR